VGEREGKRELGREGKERKERGGREGRKHPSLLVINFRLRL